MTAPLTALECDLLEAVAAGGDAERAVLGDYWIEHVDEPRGQFLQLDVGDNAERSDLADEEARLNAHVSRWRAIPIASGYREQDLAICHGFLQHPLSVAADSGLDGHPDIVRISPLYYREIRELRRGAECVIVEAEAITPRTRSRVAIKFARHPEFQDVVDHELAILRRIQHPNLVRLLGHAIRPSGRAVVLEWGGIDLRALLRSTLQNNVLLGIDFAISVGVQLLEGLAALHAADGFHREIRTDHITVSSDGTVRIIDFGSAHSADVPPFSRWHRMISPPIFRDGRFRFRYMSPEQALGRKVDARTDVFSTAGLICELVTNHHPLGEATNDMDALIRVRDANGEVPQALPPALRLAIAIAADRDRNRRPSAAAFRDTLRAAAQMARIEIGPHVIARRLVELGVPT